MKKVSLDKNLLKSSYIEMIFYCLLAGCGEIFALYYAVKRGLFYNEIALLATVPVLLGSIAQWLAPLLVNEKTLRKWKILFFSLQVIGMGLLAFSTFFDSFNLIVFFSLSLYWIGGMGAVPLWLEWASTKVPPRLFRMFLAKRSSHASFYIVLFYVSTAFFLYQKEFDVKLFFIVFAIAAFGRLVSTLIQYQISKNDHFIQRPPKPIGLHNENHNKSIILMIIFTTLFRFGVGISAPFFIPYMLEILHFSLMDYVLITAFPLFGRFLFIHQWGRHSHSLKPFLGLQVAMAMISVIPTLWVYAKGGPIYIYFILEFFSGIFWGGLELSMLLLTQKIWNGNVLKVQGMHMALLNLATVIGALVGALLLEKGHSFEDIFLESSLLRALITFAMIVFLSQQKALKFKLFHYGEFFIDALNMRPIVINLGRNFLSILPHSKKHHAKPEK